MTKTFDRAVNGFNHNIKHRGQVFHVQTEDSGVNNPHVITHLFVGGNVLASRKSSYAYLRGAENLQELVRGMMEAQHKEMLRNLVNGAYDGVDAASGPRHYQPGQLGTPEPPPARAPNPSIPVLAPVPLLPPEVMAARALGERPQIRESASETLFGEDLISEKSLDEVILSYLAGERDG